MRRESGLGTELGLVGGAVPESGMTGLSSSLMITNLWCLNGSFPRNDVCMLLIRSHLALFEPPCLPVAIEPTNES